MVLKLDYMQHSSWNFESLKELRPEQLKYMFVSNGINHGADWTISTVY